MIWSDNAREDPSLRGADVYRLGIRLPRRREKLFIRKWSFDPCRLARALVHAATVSQPLQLRCHTGTLLLFQPLRIRLRVLLLLEKLVRLLPHRSWLLRLGRIAALSPVKAAVVDSRAVDTRKLIPWSCLPMCSDSRSDKLDTTEALPPMRDSRRALAQTSSALRITALRSRRIQRRIGALTRSAPS